MCLKSHFPNLFQNPGLIVNILIEDLKILLSLLPELFISAF